MAWRAAEVGDVDEGDDDAVDAVVGGAIGEDAADVPAAGFAGDFLFEREEAVEDAAGVGEELVVVELAGEVAEGAADVGGDEVEELGVGGGVAADAEVGVEEEDGDVSAAEKAGEVVSGAFDFLDFGLELGVDGGELFVEGLEFFLGGFELFVGALEFFVDAGGFLGGGFHFLVGGLEFLDGGLELVAHAGEFFGELFFGLVVGSGDDGRGFGLFEEADEEVVGDAAFFEGGDFDLDAHAAVGGVHKAVADDDGFFGAGGALEGDAERAADGFLGEGHDFTGGFAAGLIEEAVGIAVEVDNAAVAVEDDGGGGVFVEEDAVGDLLDGGAGEGAAFGGRVVGEGAGAEREDGEIDVAVAGGSDAAEEAPFFVDGLEHGVEAGAEGFAGSEEECAAFAEAEVEEGEDAALDVGFEVDEEVAAGAEVEAAEGGILQDVLRGEDDELAHFFFDAVVGVVLVEEAGEALFAEVAFDAAGKDAGAGVEEGAVGGVGGEDFDVEVFAGGFGFFDEEHGKGIGFFAAGAGGDPGADGGVVFGGGDEGIDHSGAKGVPRVGIAEEAGDVDHEVIAEGGDFGGGLAEVAGVVAHGVELVEAHAAFDAADDGRFFVAAEIVMGAGAEDGEHFGQGFGFADGEGGGFGGAGGVAVGGVADDGFGHFGDAEDGVGEAGIDEAAGHGGVFGGFGVLGDAVAADGFNGLCAGGAVGAHAGEKDADGAFALFFGEGAEEVINGAAMAGGEEGFAEAEFAVDDGHGVSGADDVDGVGADDGAVFNLVDGHGGVLGEQFGHEAFVLGGEVLDEDEGHAGVGGKSFEEFGVGFEAAGGCTNADDGEVESGGMCAVNELLRFGRRGGMFRRSGGATVLGGNARLFVRHFQAPEAYRV